MRRVRVTFPLSFCTAQADCNSVFSFRNFPIFYPLLFRRRRYVPVLLLLPIVIVATNVNDTILNGYLYTYAPRRHRSVVTGRGRV